MDWCKKRPRGYCGARGLAKAGNALTMIVYHTSPPPSSGGLLLSPAGSRVPNLKLGRQNNKGLLVSQSSIQE